jgi:phosphoribosylaminoimidazole carboxylase (NCAIR synthetase)
MNLLRVFCLFILILVLGCGGGPTTTTTKATPIGNEFQRLCSTLGSTNGKISRAQFLANAKDKQAANQLFDACDVNHDNFITQEEAAQAPYSFENLKTQVIMFQTPRQ